MRNFLLLCTSLVLLALAPMPQEAPKLVVGSDAPSLEGLEFIQGEAEASPKVRVVEFWATWCPPCIKSIPHINEIYQAQRSSGLEVIGVSDETRAKVEPFIRKLQGQMSYTVAIDPEKKIHEAFMKAAGQGGIPCAFVIGQNNKIVFIGHPMTDEFAEAVKYSLLGRYDPVLTKRAQPILDAARRSFKLKNFKEGYLRLDEVIALDPSFFSDIAIEKYRVMLNDEKDTARAKAYATDLTTTMASAGDAGALRDLALVLSSVPGMSEYDNDLALVAAEAMVKASASADPGAQATLASVRYARGDFAKAVEAQKKAVRLAEPSRKVDYKPTLDAYELALKRGTKVAVPITASASPSASTTESPTTVPAGKP